MAAVIGTPDEQRGQVPKAFVVLRPGHSGDDALADELRAHVRVKLAHHLVPRESGSSTSFPRPPLGKSRAEHYADILTITRLSRVGAAIMAAPAR
jgi:acetyl-CoA synthetase